MYLNLNKRSYILVTSIKCEAAICINNFGLITSNKKHIHTNLSRATSITYGTITEVLTKFYLPDTRWWQVNLYSFICGSQHGSYQLTCTTTIKEHVFLGY